MAGLNGVLGEKLWREALLNESKDAVMLVMKFLAAPNWIPTSLNLSSAAPNSCSRPTFNPVQWGGSERLEVQNSFQTDEIPLKQKWYKSIENASREGNFKKFLNAIKTNKWPQEWIKWSESGLRTPFGDFLLKSPQTVKDAVIEKLSYQLWNDAVKGNVSSIASVINFLSDEEHLRTDLHKFLSALKKNEWPKEWIQDFLLQKRPPVAIHLFVTPKDAHEAVVIEFQTQWWADAYAESNEEATAMVMNFLYSPIETAKKWEAKHSWNFSATNDALSGSKTIYEHLRSLKDENPRADAVLLHLNDLIAGKRIDSIGWNFNDWRTVRAALASNEWPQEWVYIAKVGKRPPVAVDIYQTPLKAVNSSLVRELLPNALTGDVLSIAQVMEELSCPVELQWHESENAQDGSGLLTKNLSNDRNSQSIHGLDTFLAIERIFKYTCDALLDKFAISVKLNKWPRDWLEDFCGGERPLVALNVFVTPQIANEAIKTEFGYSEWKAAYGQKSRNEMLKIANFLFAPLENSRNWRPSSWILETQVLGFDKSSLIGSRNVTKNNSCSLVRPTCLLEELRCQFEELCNSLVSNEWPQRWLERGRLGLEPLVDMKEFLSPSQAFCIAVANLGVLCLYKALSGDDVSMLSLMNFLSCPPHQYALPPAVWCVRQGLLEDCDEWSGDRKRLELPNGLNADLVRQSRCDENFEGVS